MKLKEAIIYYLELEKLEKKDQDDIVKKLTNILIERALDSIMDEMNPKDLKDVNNSEKNLDKFQEIFFKAFDNQIKETLYEFRSEFRKKNNKR